MKLFLAKRDLSLVLLFLVVGWTVGQPNPCNPDDDDEAAATPPRSVARFRLVRNRRVDPAMGGLRPSTSALPVTATTLIIQATSVHAALDLLTMLDQAAMPDQSADLSASLGPEDDGKHLQINIKSTDTQGL